MKALRRASALSRRVGALAAVLALAAGGVWPAHAGGPLDLVNHQPVVYPNGGAALTLNLDQGNLGTRTNAQAVTLVQNAIALWNGVGTSTLNLAIGSQLAADITAANYTSLLQNFFDGLNPVIFDTDGAITDAIFGAGTKNYVLGFAGSAYTTVGPSAGKYLEGRSVLNGYINISDATWTVVFAHELGHFFGLDHSQLDGTQGLAQNNYVLMYPIAYRTLQSLHEDDVAAVTASYPAANIATVYGQLAGTFTTAGGTPILGANLWAREISTGKVYSIVSDYLTQGSGYFRLYLPAGTYNLYAESIAPAFNGGSGVGPYANFSGDVSFQTPHPIAPVGLGVGSALPILISPGCVAAATFRLDGTGSVAGNCAPPDKLLTVTRSGTGSGTVTSTPAGIDCGSDCTEFYGNGTPVLLTATASAGSIFTAWSGACSGTALTCAVLMTDLGTVDAGFAALSTNANLAALAFSAGTLSPPFVPATLGYAATVDYGVASVTVTPTAADGGATIKVNGTPVSSGGASGAIGLAVGNNPIVVLVTAADGTTTQTTTVTVTRAPSATTTGLASSADPVDAGSGVTLTAIVTGAGPTGTVSFRNGAAVISGCGDVALTGNGNSRTAQCPTGPLTAGSYVFLAIYGGDAVNVASAGSVSQTVTSVPGPDCAGFTDVDTGSIFCANIDWVKNRKAVPDCGGGDSLYCPITSVTRNEMAVFLYGLGNAMTPIAVVRQATTGALVPDDDPVVCQTSDTLVTEFPRRADVDAIFMATASADLSFAVDPVASFDAGANWWPLTVNSSLGLVEAGHWANLRLTTVQQVEVGQTVRFGLQVSRGGQPGTANLSDSRCNLRAILHNRNGTFSPF